MPMTLYEMGVSQAAVTSRTVYIYGNARDTLFIRAQQDPEHPDFSTPFLPIAFFSNN